MSAEILTEYRLTASLWIMIVGYFIEYTRGADYFIFTTGILILIAKIFDIIDLFQNKAVADPSFKYR